MIKKIVFAILLIGCSNAFANDEYYKCMESSNDESSQIRCMNTNTRDMLLQLKSIYEGLAKDERFKKWNGSDNMQTGNLRTMYSEWLKYRERYCSFSAVAGAEYMNSPTYNNALCVYTVTKEHLNGMKELYGNANTDLD